MDDIREIDPFLQQGTTLINPLQPNISMHILHTVLNTLRKVIRRRICLIVKNFLGR